MQLHSVQQPIKPQPNYLWLEFSALFICVPLLLWAFNQSLNTILLPLMVCIAGSCGYVLWRDHHFKRNRLGWRKTNRQHIVQLMIKLSGVICVGLLWALIIAPEQSFYLFENGINQWLLLLILYPLLSALPQELVFRTFLMHRYKHIVKRKQHRIWLSSLAFGFAHIFYGNWIAVVLSVFAGYIFCMTYVKTKSTLLVALEHSLWGLVIFTFGIGAHFDTGML